MPAVKSSRKSKMNVITQMLNVIVLRNFLVTAKVIAACTVTLWSQPCGPISKNCEPEGNLPGYQYLGSHFERPISLEMPLQSNTDAILPLVLTFNLPLWQESLQRNEKLLTYHKHTSSDMQPRVYHRVMVPAGCSKSFSMVVSFVSVGETLQDSHY
jgi:hypothetical protein